VKGERRKYYRFIELTGKEKLLFCEALSLQLWVGLLLMIIPFRWIPRFFKNKVQGTRCMVQGIDNKEHENIYPEPCIVHPVPLTLVEIKAAIQSASRVSPWKNKCLVSSLAARRMLTKRKIQSEVSLGVAKDKTGRMIAHAWVRADDYEVVEKKGSFTELYLF
jgi:hypothetical protein